MRAPALPVHAPAPQVVWEPLAVPPTDQPLVRVDRFGCLWSSHSLPECAGAAGGLSYATAGAGGVDVVGSDKGVTVWRPQPPVGYAILGDVLSSGGHAAQTIVQPQACQALFLVSSAHGSMIKQLLQLGQSQTSSVLPAVFRCRAQPA
jgi:hypothetical protein